MKKFLLNLLKTENHEDDILELFKQMIQEGHKGTVLRLLDLYEHGKLYEGQIVTLKNDKLQKELVVLRKN